MCSLLTLHPISIYALGFTVTFSHGLLSGLYLSKTDFTLWPIMTHGSVSHIAKSCLGGGSKLQTDDSAHNPYNTIGTKGLNEDQ